MKENNNKEKANSKMMKIKKTKSLSMTGSSAMTVLKL